MSPTSRSALGSGGWHPEAQRAGPASTARSIQGAARMGSLSFSLSHQHRVGAAGARQADPEAGARALGEQLERPPVVLHEAAGHGQAEAGPALLAVGDERLE